MTDVMSRTHYRACEVMRFRDMNEVIKCCIYTITLLYTRIKLTGIMLIRDRNSFNYISQEPDSVLNINTKQTFQDPN